MLGLVVSMVLSKRSIVRASMAAVVLGLIPAPILAQQPAATPVPETPWQTGVEVKRPAPPAKPPAAPSPATPNVTVVPRGSADTKIDASAGEITPAAYLTEDGERIEQGVVWRVYMETTAPLGAKGTDAKPRLVGTWRDASPVLRLPVGEYLVNVTFGRAHMTRKVKISGSARAPERFVLNAGGLRVSAALAGGEPGSNTAVSYDVYQGETDQLGARAKILSNAKPGLIVRLNAGIYHIVSSYGDANAIVRADVTVEAGKLTEATVNHHGAKVTFKLVTRTGGEAQADTQWSVFTAQGDLVRETMGALPTHVLAAGDYVVNAAHGGRVYKREFTVATGQATEVEVVMR